VKSRLLIIILVPIPTPSVLHAITKKVYCFKGATETGMVCSQASKDIKKRGTIGCWIQPYCAESTASRHVKEKLKEDPERWQPKINALRLSLPIDFKKACALNEEADKAASKGTQLPKVLTTDNPGLYPLSKVTFCSDQNTTTTPCNMLKKMWANSWTRPTPKNPKRKDIAHATDTGVYGFFIRAIHNVLPLRSEVYGKTKSAAYDSLHCVWCATFEDREIQEDLDHCLAACLAHNQTRTEARVDIAEITRKMDAVQMIPMATADDWLGLTLLDANRPTKSDTRARHDVQATLLTASHKMWLDRCKHLHEMGMMNNAQRIEARLGPVVAGPQSGQRTPHTGTSPLRQMSSLPPNQAGPPPIRATRHLRP
jgi:hypothetical protein